MMTMTSASLSSSRLLSSLVLWKLLETRDDLEVSPSPLTLSVPSLGRQDRAADGNGGAAAAGHQAANTSSSRASSRMSNNNGKKRTALLSAHNLGAHFLFRCGECGC